MIKEMLIFIYPTPCLLAGVFKSEPDSLGRKNMNREYSSWVLHWLFIVTISTLWKFLLLSLICPYPKLPDHNESVTNKGGLHQEGNKLKGLEKRIFTPPGALLTPVTRSSGLHKGPLCSDSKTSTTLGNGKPIIMAHGCCFHLKGFNWGARDPEISIA